MQSRMVRQHARAERTPADTLRDLLDETVATMKPDLSVLIDRTYLRPTGAQEHVADSLHLSFNTYRRHRDKAITQLTEILWDRETGSPRGRPVPGSTEGTHAVQ
jgi:hypothetical protein